MTAIALITSDDGIVVASDGAIVGPNDILIAHGSKVVLAPEWSCVLANRGVVGFASALKSHIGAAPDFDAVLECTRDEVRLVYEEFKNISPENHHATVYLAGWSERRKAYETYRVSTREHRVVDRAAGEDRILPAFTLDPLPTAFAAPGPSDDHVKQFSIPCESKSLEEDAIWAMKIICAARQSGSDDSGPRVWHIGSFLQLTVIKRLSIVSNVVHCWPDPMGEKIDPRRGELMPAFLRSVV
jgi:hypothetical protein